MKYIIAKKCPGENAERFWGGDAWSMLGELQRAYVFNSISEMFTVIENSIRRYPKSTTDKWKAYEVNVEFSVPSPPPPPRIEIVQEV